MQEAWSKRDHPNLHIMWFEDMKSDFNGEIEKLQKFLGTNVSGETMEELKKRVNIEKMTATAVKEMGGAGKPPKRQHLKSPPQED